MYPDEPVKKLWSLLKVKAKDYSLASSKTPQVPLKRGSIGEISKGEDLTLVISKNKGSSETGLKYRGSANSRGASEKKSADEKASSKTRKEVSSISKDGSHVTNVNISISIDSHSSYGGRSMSDSKRSSADKKEVKPKKLPSRESSLGGRSLKGSSKSLKEKNTVRDSKSSSRELGASRHSKVSAKDGISTQSPEEDEKMELVTEGNVQPPKKAMSFQSAFPPEITPKSRAKSLSKHLSVSSLHKTSFKGSARKLEVIHEAESNMLETRGSEPGELLSTASIRRRDQADDEDATPAKKRSNNSAEGINTFVLPSDSPHDVTLTKQPSSLHAESMGGTVEQPLVDRTHQLREISKSPVTVTEEEVKKTGFEQEPDYDSAENGDGTLAKGDPPPGATVVAGPPSLQILEPLPQPPANLSDDVIAHPKTSGGIETHIDGINTSTLPVRGNTIASGEDDIYSEMKNLVSSAILDRGAIHNGKNAAEADKRVPNTSSLNRDSSSQSVNDEPRRRRKSSEAKPIQNREDWHPVEDPPSIRGSDVDFTLDETLPVEPKTSERKKSDDPNNSEQIFERYQHPEAAISPTVEQQDAIERTGGAQKKEELAKDNETIEKVDNQDGMKEKAAEDAESAKRGGDDGEAAAGLAEYVANIYPNEKLGVLWSLLKMTSKDHPLVSLRNPEKRIGSQDRISSHSLRDGSCLMILSDENVGNTKGAKKKEKNASKTQKPGKNGPKAKSKAGKEKPTSVKSNKTPKKN